MSSEPKYGYSTKISIRITRGQYFFLKIVFLGLPLDQWVNGLTTYIIIIYIIITWWSNRLFHWFWARESQACAIPLSLGEDNLVFTSTHFNICIIIMMLVIMSNNRPKLGMNSSIDQMSYCCINTLVFRFLRRWYLAEQRLLNNDNGFKRCVEINVDCLIN